MTLYEIMIGIEEAYDACYDEETGEINEAAYTLLEDLEADKDKKVENIAMLIKNLRAEAAALKAEKMEFAKRQAAAEKKAEWYTDYLAKCLVPDYVDGKKKWEYQRAVLSFRKSDAVVIDDPDIIDDEFMIIKKEPSKAEIKKALKDGAFMMGAHLEENLNLQVK